MPTKADKTRQELSVEQLNAIDVLVTGKTDAETAAAVGMSRQTVNGWRNHHPDFIAALNARRLETWGVSCDRLRALLPKALDALDAAVTGGGPDGWKAAVKVVELAGLDRQGAGVPNLGPYSIGATDVEGVIEMEAKRRRRDHVTDFLDGGAPSPAEMNAILRELDALTD